MQTHNAVASPTSFRNASDATDAPDTDDILMAPADGARIVLIDDDPLFRESLGMNLTDCGYDVVDFPGGLEALDYFDSGQSGDIILLDWRMPGIDGLEVLRRLRERKIDLPVIFLTVIDDDIYEEAALDGGAVDFIDKSRRLSIVLKRIAIIIGGRKGAAGEEEEEKSENLTLGAISLNLETRRAYWKEKLVSLTLTEFNIVALLIDRDSADVSYREIYDMVHGKGFYAGSGPEGYRANVRTFIKRIRMKFKEVDGDFNHIENYPGFGYRWRVD